MTFLSLFCNRTSIFFYHTPYWYGSNKPKKVNSFLIEVGLKEFMIFLNILVVIIDGKKVE
jgi:hypothetical protein